MHNIDKARSDFHTALEPADQQREDDLKADMEEKLTQLANLTPQDGENDKGTQNC